MGTFDYSAPPPPALRGGRISWSWTEQELRELADTLRRQGWAAVTPVDSRKEAKGIAASLAVSLMRRRDLWPARDGEGLPRYLATRTTDGDKCQGYVVVDNLFVGIGDKGSPVRVYADGSRVQTKVTKAK